MRKVEDAIQKDELKYTWFKTEEKEENMTWKKSKTFLQESNDNSSGTPGTRGEAM